MKKSFVELLAFDVRVANIFVKLVHNSQFLK